jgi:hypothetical protein
VELFDPELYLRLLGERMLIEHAERRPRMRQDALGHAADALVAVGAVSPATVESVLNDYELARALRNENEFRHRVAFNVPPAASPESPAAPRPWRVVPTEATIEHTWGTEHVRYVSLSPTSTSVGVLCRFDAAQARPSRRPARGPMVAPGSPWGGRPRRVTLVDDRGQSVSAGFHGGGGDSEWTGQLTAAQPLASDTAWIEVDGHRIELTDGAWPCEVTVEDLPERSPAHRYLWELLADPGHGHVEGEDVKAAIDALIAAGAITGDDPALVHVQAISEQGWRGMAGPPQTDLAGMPEEWRSLLSSAGRHTGPRGTIALGAMTPTFAGVTVAVIELESHGDRFQLEVEIEGDTHHRRRGPFRSGPSGPRLLWWAKDDRGGHYLGGSWGRWSGSGGRSEGEIHFWPPLDPRARTLALMPTVGSTRAVMSFELPWAK